MSTLLSAFSCGAAIPVTGLDVLLITDHDTDPVLPPLISDLNRASSYLFSPENRSLFPSSFQYDSCRPVLPSFQSLSEDPSSSALLCALRGKGVPLSYKTDREAVEWAVSSLIPNESASSLNPFRSWLGRIRDCASAGEKYRIAVLCDLSDPFSAGTAFAVLRLLNGKEKIDPSAVALFCLGIRTEQDNEQMADTFYESVYALGEQDLVGRPDQPETVCADAVWLLSLPSSLIVSDESLRILYVALARHLGRFFSSGKAPAPGLHTAELPGILTFQSLGDQAWNFASFLHTSAWLLSDLLPAVSSFSDHPSAIRSLAPNSRNGLFRRLFRGSSLSEEQHTMITVLDRALRAVLSEVLALIRSLPDFLRLAELSDPAWRKAVDACGRTVTVASEYDVSLLEAQEAGVLDVKPVHRASMADTEEEKLGHRLDAISAQLKSETDNRDKLFISLGGCHSVLALIDCRTRCKDALARARVQYDKLSSEPGTEHLKLASLSRRVRLLEAAVARCDRDISDKDLLRRINVRKSTLSEAVSPLASQLLNEQAAAKISSLLMIPYDTAEPSRKELIGLMPSLLFGSMLPDVKALFRQLSSGFSFDISEDPVVCLFLSALSVSVQNIQAVHFISDGQIPSIPLLPDLYPSEPPLTVSSLLPLIPVSSDRSAHQPAELRGLLAMLLLRQYRRRNANEAVMSMEQYLSSDSPVLEAWLSSRRSSSVWIVSLGSGEDKLPFALIHPCRSIIAARYNASHAALVPAFSAPWFDEDSLFFRDPCGLLCESDRTILLEQLAEMVNSCSDACAGSLRSFLDSFLKDLSLKPASLPLPERFDLRLKAAYGLRLLPAFRQSLLRIPCYYERFLHSDGIAACLLDKTLFKPSVCSVSDDIVFLYKDVPFARENSRTLLESVPLPAENVILNLLEQECAFLSRTSDDYHDNLARELSLLLERNPEAQQDARQIALDTLEQAEKPVTDTSAELVWPWDPKSPSVMTILSESLGEVLALSSVMPFSDQLCLFPARGNEVIGDSLIASMCLLPPLSGSEEQQDTPSVLPDAVLPPLSADFCASLCRLPEGRTLIRRGFLSFDRREEQVIRVTLTLEGSFIVRLIRDYSEEEIVCLYAHDIPTLAVWPNLPFPREDWHAYFIYASLSSLFSISAYTSDSRVAFPESRDKRTVLRSESFPLSFSFFREERCMGSLPNLLPSPVIGPSGTYTACIDFGSVGTSVVFSIGHERRPLSGPTMVRTLISNPSQSRDLLRKEFLPAVPVSALLPTASRIFRNVPGEAPLPFEDGIVLMSSDLQDVLSIPSGALYTCLKWEEEKGRSVELCMHQIMLMAALQARYEGAASLLWRFSVPDEMAKTGRERLTALFSSLSELVNSESGFSVPDRTPLVTFGSESAALGAYFRFCASEDTRGGFMILDIGACTADISLFLRGREQPVRTCQIPLGVHYMLLPALLRDPGILAQDLGFIQDPSFRQDLLMLEQILRNANADTQALRHSRLALDNFIADRYSYILPGLLQNPMTGMPSRLGSILLLHFSFLMMLSGLILLQISADPGKNDFLPEQMSLCLSGRGSLLPEALPEQYKTGLWHFLTMFRNRRVASLSLLFSSEKKMEIPVGLSLLQDTSTGVPAAFTVPSAIPVRPEELLPHFILRFAREFPGSSEILFHGFFTGDQYHPFTPYGESLISAAISHSFTEQTVLRPFDALSSWIGSLLDLVQDSGT